MSTLLYRIGRAAAARPWRVIGGWLAVLAIALTLSMTLGAGTRDDYRVAGSPAQAGADFLDSHFEGSFGRGRPGRAAQRHRRPAELGRRGTA